jgi:uncharacterized protein (DUF433 family)
MTVSRLPSLQALSIHYNKAKGATISMSPHAVTGGTMLPDWRLYIHADPDILAGKPVIKGTRLAVEFVLELFAAGWSMEAILESYPSLTPEALQAVFAYSAEVTREEGLSVLEPS